MKLREGCFVRQRKYETRNNSPWNTMQYCPNLCKDKYLELISIFFGEDPGSRIEFSIEIHNHNCWRYIVTPLYPTPIHFEDVISSSHCHGTCTWSSDVYRTILLNHLHLKMKSNNRKHIQYKECISTLYNLLIRYARFGSTEKLHSSEVEFF